MVGATYSIYKWGPPGSIGERVERFTKLKIECRWAESWVWSIESMGLERAPFKIGDGITIYRNRTAVLDGIVESVEEHCNEANSGVISWTVSGRDLMSLLERRIALPDPVGLRFDESLQDVFRGSAEAAIRYFCNRNAASGAVPDRRIAKFEIENSTSGTGDDSYAYRLKTLYEIVREVGQGRMTAEVRRDFKTGLLTLKVVPRREMAESVIFGVETGTVLSWKKRSHLPRRNALWAAGGGEGTDRIVVFAKSEESISTYGRFEGFLSETANVQSGGSDGAPAVTVEDVKQLLDTKAVEALRRGAATVSYSVEVREGPRTRFMADWRCGDRVSCIIGGERIVSTIDSVSIDYGATGETVAAVIGDVERGIFASLFTRITELQKGLATEEAR